MPKILEMTLKAEYFDEILSGEKKYEFRLRNLKWTQKLENRKYDYIELFKEGTGEVLSGKYKGYQHRKIQHKHFGDDLVKVYAIPVDHLEYVNEDDLPSFNDLHGMAPDATKGVPAEEFVANIRSQEEQK